MGKGSMDTSSVDALSSAAQQAVGLAKEQFAYGKEWADRFARPVAEQQRTIVSGGEPAYAALQKSGLYDPYIRQIGSWERGQREKALDVAGLGPASKYMATTGISQQAEGMKSQGLMSQLQGMMAALTGTGTQMYGTAGGLGASLMGTGVSGLGSAAQMQSQLQMASMGAQAGVWNNIIGSIGSIGGGIAGGLPWEGIAKTQGWIA